MIVVKNKQEFETQVLQAKKTVLVDFFATWCGPCQMMEPVFERFAAENPEIIIAKVNVDEAQDLAMQYNVMSIPTLYVFKNGKVVKQLIGLQTEESLKQAVA
jgi:thioredoxin 1